MGQEVVKGSVLHCVLVFAYFFVHVYITISHCVYILRVPMIGANFSSCECSPVFDDKPEFNLYPRKTIIISN